MKNFGDRLLRGFMSFIAAVTVPFALVVVSMARYERVGNVSSDPFMVAATTILACIVVAGSTFLCGWCAYMWIFGRVWPRREFPNQKR